MDYLVGYMSYISFYVTKFLFIEGRKQYILQRMAPKQLSVIFIAAGENCPTELPWAAHGTVNGSTAQNDSAL